MKPIEPAPDGDRDNATPLRIVIVEDDCLIGMDLADLLAEEGHDVCAVADTEPAAVAAAARFAPDLMIVDAHLQEGSGMSAMRQILAVGYVPHIYVSGDPMGVLAEVPGAVVIDKPFAMRTLLKAIAQARSPAGPALPRVEAG